MLKIRQDSITGVEIDNNEDDVLRKNTIKTVSGIIDSERQYFCFKVKGIVAEETYIGKSANLATLEGQLFNEKLHDPSDGKKFSVHCID